MCGAFSFFWASSPARRRAAGRRGFTLVEAMVGTVVFAMVTMGVYTALIKSYQLAALARTRDEARAVLRTFADQFERLQTTDEVDGITCTRWLFLPTSGPTGRGLQWQDSTTGTPAMSSDNTSVNAEETPYLSVTLGAGSAQIPAQVTRDVAYVSESTGTTAAQQITAAGYLLRGTFAISYQLNGRSYSQSLTVARSVP
jgi:prepilin-type N-terminal cleavage/methylation domain-containing protein